MNGGRDRFGGPCFPERRNLPVMASADTVSGVISSKSLRFSPGRDPHGRPPLISKVTSDGQPEATHHKTCGGSIVIHPT